MVPPPEKRREGRRPCNAEVEWAFFNLSLIHI